jgi:GT2 family glycosyltransferase
VILNWNRAELTLACVAGVRSQVHHVYVVDNGSRSDDRAKLEGARDPSTTIVLNQENLGYAGGCNRGIRAAMEDGFERVLIMNNDAFPYPRAVASLMARLDVASDLGAVGPVVVQRGTRTVLHVGCSLNPRTGRVRWLQHGLALEAIDRSPVASDYLSGEAILARSELIEAVGLFDERYFCYYEDLDWCVRARRAGWGLEVSPAATFEHILGATSAGATGTYYRARNLPLFLRIALNQTRFSAFARCAPAEVMNLLALIRRGQFGLGVRYLCRGWIVGITMRY